MKNKIFLSPPDVNSLEKNSLIDAFESNWIAPLGPNVDLFEEEVSDYLDIKSGCALSSGTAALHLALIILGIKKNDIVLCSSLTFAASANAILYQGAQPIFIDSDPSTWTIDIASLEKAIKKFKPKVLIAVDLYGQSCDYDLIADLCNKYKVLVIEDAAEAFGSDYKGKKCGTFGDIGILSFNGNKIITTSGGGMLVSKNEDYVNRAHFLATQSREKKIYYEHKELGFNYRLSNLLAAIGRAQLSKLENFINKRIKIFDRYYNALSSIDGLSFMENADYGKSNRWLTTLTVDTEKTGVSRDEIIQRLEKNNIEARPVWKPMHLQPLYKDCHYISNNSKDISKKLFFDGLCLPSGSNLTQENQLRVIDIILSILK